MRIMGSLATRVVCLLAALGAAQAQESPDQAVLGAAQAQDSPDQDPVQEQDPVACPLVNSGFNELSAVGQLLLARNSPAEAEACFLDALSSSLPVVRVLSDLAANRGEFGRAASFSQLLEMMDAGDETKMLHAARLLQNNENDHAAKRLRQLIEGGGTDAAETHHLYGIALHRLGQADAAAHLAKAVELQPNSEKYRTVLQQATEV